MIGFVTTQEQATAANAAIAEAQTSRGMPVFWLAGSCLIHSGKNAGKHFVPCDNAILSTPLVGKPPLTPRDFPEFQQIIDSLGGLDARVEIDPYILIDPNATTDP